MVRLNECSSYRGFELSSDFCEKVLVKVQREFSLLNFRVLINLRSYSTQIV